VLVEAIQKKPTSVQNPDGGVPMSQSNGILELPWTGSRPADAPDGSGTGVEEVNST
jgi:hypothetical protein